MSNQDQYSTTYTNWQDIPLEGWGFDISFFKSYRSQKMEGKEIAWRPSINSPEEGIAWYNKVKELLAEDPDNRTLEERQIAPYEEGTYECVVQWPPLHLAFREVIEERNRAYRKAKEFGLDVAEPISPIVKEYIVWRRMLPFDETPPKHSEGEPPADNSFCGMPSSLKGLEPWLPFDLLKRHTHLHVPSPNRPSRRE